MLAKEVAEKLKAAGIVVTKVAEGDYNEDGEVTITDRVTVQVGYFSSYMHVVQQLDDETFQFYPEAPDVPTLVADIRKALAPAE